jgi:hypothetical protein
MSANTLFPSLALHVAESVLEALNGKLSISFLDELKYDSRVEIRNLFFLQITMPFAQRGTKLKYDREV